MHVQVTQFLYRHIGLDHGMNAVITNGKVSMFTHPLNLEFDFWDYCYNMVSWPYHVFLFNLFDENDLKLQISLSEILCCIWF